MSTNEHKEQSDRYVAARKYLAKNNLLATTAPCNTFTIANALTLTLDKTKGNQNWDKIIPHFSEVVLKIDQHCGGCDRNTGILILLEDLKTELKEDIVKTDNSIAKLTEHLDKVMDRLETAATEMHGKLLAVSSMSTQLETTANTYKDALLKIPAQLNSPRIGQGEIDPAISRSTDRKSRQVLIDFADNQITALSTAAISEKFMDAAKQTLPPHPTEFAIEEVTKLKNNGVVILLSTKEAAGWVQDPDIEIDLAT